MSRWAYSAAMGCHEGAHGGLAVRPDKNQIGRFGAANVRQPRRHLLLDRPAATAVNDISAEARDCAACAVVRAGTVDHCLAERAVAALVPKDAVVQVSAEQARADSAASDRRRELSARRASAQEGRHE